jgi:hypothetical protein
VANNEVGFSIKVNGVEQTVKSLTELQGAIRDLTKEAASADYGSAAYEEIVGRIQQAKAAVKEFKNDTRTKEVKDQFNDLAGGISGSFDVAEGALKSFGVESKALGTISSTANGLITAALNARQIAELKVDAAVALRTTTEKAAAVATRLFGKEALITNAILSANPIGLIVTALAALVIGVTVAIGAVKKFGAAFKPLGDAIDFVIGKARDLASALTFGLIDDSATAKTRDNAEKVISSLDDVGSAQNKMIAASKRRLALMEAQGATEEQLLAQKKKINQEEVASRTAAINQLLKLQQIDGELDDDKKKKLTELQAAVKDLNNQALIDQAAYDKQKQDKAKEANTKAAEKEKERKEKYNEHLKEIQDKTVESEKKILELKQKAEIDAIKDADQKAQKELEIQQKNAQALVQVEIDKLAKKKALTAEEQKYLNSLYAQQKQLGVTQAQETQNLLDTQAEAKKEKEATFQKELEEIKNNAFLLNIENARTRAAAELQIELDKQIAEINASELTETQKGEKIAAVKAVNQAKVDEQNAGFKQKDMEDELAFNQWQIQQEGTTYAEKIALNDANQKLITEMTFENEDQRTMAIAENAKARKEIDDAAAAAKEANLNAISSLLQNASALAGQDTVAGKAIAIAGTTIDTYQSATKAYKSLVGIPVIGPALAAVAAGVAIAGGLMNVKKIMSVQTPTGNISSGGGGGAAPRPSASKFASGGYVSGAGTSVSDSIPAMLSNGESVINANSTEMFGGLLNQINQAGGGAPIQTQNGGGNNAAPIFKTYVVASDVSSQQEADKRINDLAKI